MMCSLWVYEISRTLQLLHNDILLYMEIKPHLEPVMLDLMICEYNTDIRNIKVDLIVNQGLSV